MFLLRVDQIVSIFLLTDGGSHSYENSAETGPKILKAVSWSGVKCSEHQFIHIVTIKSCAKSLEAGKLLLYF